MRAIIVVTLLVALCAPAAAGPVPQAAPAPAGGRQTAAPRKLDVNRASAAELVNVPGIGERLAQAIVELRERKGTFATLEDLLEVRGIGEKSLALLGEHLAVGQPAPTAAGGMVSQTK